MQLTIEHEGNLTSKQTHENRLTLVKTHESRLDASIAPQFKSQMDEIIKENKGNVILDISSISFMDSSSLGAMVAVLKLMGNQGKLVIVGASGTVLELFKLTRMDRVFTLASDIEEAKKEINE